MRYDIHNHTWFSRCSTLDPARLIKLAKARGLQGIGVTDHDTIKGGEYTKKINTDKDFEVIVGSEVYTDRGHVLGIFLNKDIKSRVYEEVIEEIKDQGGISVIAHPYRYLPGAYFKWRSLDKSKLPDAIEIANSRTNMFGNKKAKKLALELGKPMTGGSDAHFEFEVASCYSEFEGDFRKALLKGSTRGFGKGRGFFMAGPLSGLAKLTCMLGLRKKHG